MQLVFSVQSENTTKKIQDIIAEKSYVNGSRRYKKNPTIYYIIYFFPPTYPNKGLLLNFTDCVLKVSGIIDGGVREGVTLKGLSLLNPSTKILNRTIYSMKGVFRQKKK